MATKPPLKKKKGKSVEPQQEVNVPVDDKSGAANQLKPKRAQKNKKLVSIGKAGPGPVAAANGNQAAGVQGAPAPVDPASVNMANTMMKTKQQIEQ